MAHSLSIPIKLYFRGNLDTTERVNGFEYGQDGPRIATKISVFRIVLRDDDLERSICAPKPYGRDIR